MTVFSNEKDPVYRVMKKLFEILPNVRLILLTANNDRKIFYRLGCLLQKAFYNHIKRTYRGQSDISRLWLLASDH